jgi:hypothetical protein
VEPAGWLRDWGLAARYGFTGHMDEYDAEFKRAWAPDHKMTGELSRLLCEWVESELGVAQQRIYINFADVPASLWGWNGETF